MQRALRPPRLGNWLAFMLMAAGSCVFAFIIPNWYHRFRHALLDGIVDGAFAGQFLWSVAWCALGPGRWLFRYLAVVASGIVIAGALIGGIYGKFETEAERREAQTDRIMGREFSRRDRARHDVWQAALAFPLSLLVCQFPLAWNRSYRGWRIAFRESDSPSTEAELLKFGLSELLAAAAGAAIALGFWRLNMSEMSKSVYGTEDALVATLFCIFLSLLAGSLMLPVASFVLGDRSANIALASNLIYVSGIAMALVVARLLLDPPSTILGAAVALFGYLCAALSSTSVMFWIAREFGYRLVRGRRRGMMERWSARVIKNGRH